MARGRCCFESPGMGQGIPVFKSPGLGTARAVSYRWVPSLAISYGDVWLAPNMAILVLLLYNALERTYWFWHAKCRRARAG